MERRWSRRIVARMVMMRLDCMRLMILQVIIGAAEIGRRSRPARVVRLVADEVDGLVFDDRQAGGRRFARR